METETSSTRLFEKDFWERFSHVHHSTPFFIYIPVMVVSLSYAFFIKQLSLNSLIGLFALGILNWTLFEYGMHRILFHYKPKSNLGKRILYILHEVHHEYPNEADRLVMPPLTSIPLAITLFGIHYGLFGLEGLPLFTGLMAGYLYYEFVHYSVHNSKRKIGWTENQRKNHLKHHFKDATNRFGVTSPLWDYIFGTYRQKN